MAKTRLEALLALAQVVAEEQGGRATKRDAAPLMGLTLITLQRWLLGQTRYRAEQVDDVQQALSESSGSQVMVAGSPGAWCAWRVPSAAERRER